MSVKQNEFWHGLQLVSQAANNLMLERLLKHRLWAELCHYLKTLGYVDSGQGVTDMQWGLT